MRPPFASHKIRAEHLARLALIYIRQSTLVQVLENVGRKARQYNLFQHAFDLGWSQAQIVVVDQDQGLSTASAAERDGFQFVIAQAGLGHAGAVLSLEVSRLARSCSDWHRLIEVCALTDTLVIDEEGVYDPSQYNDRLLLGLKGAMSEAELHWLRSRLLGGKLEKARRGTLRLPLLTGLVYDAASQVTLDPDEEIQHAVQLVFDLFDELGTATAVVRHFANHQLVFPTRQPDGELIWKASSSRRVLSILHNPTYAGAYAYGRTRTQTLLDGGVQVKKYTRQLNPDDWPILLLDAHSGYITWQQFLHNQKRLDDNRTSSDKDRRGAAREGTALLQGIVLCGRCGRRMTIRYLDDDVTPVYNCPYAYHQFAEPICQSFRGDGVDVAVARVFLEAMQPAQLQVSIAALEQIQAQARQIDQQWQLRIERAHYEADLARRRFFVVEPENRLVARSLEREWNEKLAEIERLEREYATSPKPTTVLADPHEQQRILALAQDLPSVWHAPSTTYTERKQLLRFMIQDVTLTRRESTIHIGIRWQTEALTELETPRPKRIYELQRTDPAVISRISKLTPWHTDRQIADLLNREGLTTGVGQLFTNDKVERLRRTHNIPTGCLEAPSACPGGQRGDGRYSIQAAVKLLNVSDSTITSWCKSGRLDGIQGVQGGPWWIKLTPESIAKLHRPVRRRRSSRSPK